MKDKLKEEIEAIMKSECLYEYAGINQPSYTFLSDELKSISKKISDLFEALADQIRKETLEGFAKWHNESISKFPERTLLHMTMKRARLISEVDVQLYLKSVSSKVKAEVLKCQCDCGCKKIENLKLYQRDGESTLLCPDCVMPYDQ